MLLAIAATIADEPRQVDTFIRYHLSIGFDRLYLYFDVPNDQAIDIARGYPQVIVTICDQHWREQCIDLLDSYNKLDSAIYEAEVMIRQEVNLRFAIERARKDKITWLLHIDSDELFYTPSPSVRTHFTELYKRGIRNVIYRNSEALIHTYSVDFPFQNTTLFKRNYFGDNGWSYVPSQRKYLKSLGIKPEYYFHFYQNGKSAVYVNQKIEVESVHFFLTEIPPLIWNQDKARILHFPCPTYQSFEQKYRRLGKFSDSWRGGPRAGDFISLIHLRARDAYLSGQTDALKTLFFEHVTIDDPQTINELRSQKLLDEINNIPERILSRETLTSEIETQQASLHKRCLTYFTNRQCSSSSIMQFNSIFTRFNLLIRQIYPQDQLAERVIISSVERITEVISTYVPSGHNAIYSEKEYEWFNSYQCVGARLTLEQIGNSVEEIRARLCGLRNLGVNYLSLTAIGKSRKREMEQIISFLVEYGIAFGVELKLDDHQRSHQWVPDDSGIFTTVLDNLLHLICLGSYSIHLTGMLNIGNWSDHEVEHNSDWPLIIEAFRILASLISPQVILVSEVIHCPERVRQFIATEGASLGSRPLLTATLWQSMMSGDIRILRTQLSRWSSLPWKCNWINSLIYNYEIEWTFSEDTLAEQNPDIDIKLFYWQLTSFYQNKQDRNFPRGYQSAKNGIFGTTASLSGLEKALDNNNSIGVEKSISRILLLHSVIFSIGGLPMINYGDVFAEINSFETFLRKRTSTKYNDDLFNKNSWEGIFLALESEDSIINKIFKKLKILINKRKQLPELSKHKLEFIDVNSHSCLVYLREDNLNQFIFIGNFSSIKKNINWLDSENHLEKYQWENILESNEVLKLPKEIKPYQYYWLRREKCI
ncbi:glycosyltransferase family 2 protein [Vibrio cincinnatiensis]|uniref:glycosyltransferase family 2 protein n=1 Tax=Vibrio cincinnatiensis TaxID=675 RepID=UPI001EE12E5B|nr:glycosyltransferase family 2 protein [Vibrio cincinnatiensis]MCG3723709.1 hypothetical protein [Vibrio cincinnatiensis]